MLIRTAEWGAGCGRVEVGACSVQTCLEIARTPGTVRGSTAISPSQLLSIFQNFVPKHDEVLH